VNKKIIFLSVVGILAFSFPYVYGQEIQLATFQESAQIVVDQQISKNVTASITLQSTSNQEMKIPSELESRILNDQQIIAIVITNEENCVLGVFDESCILINVKRDDSWEGINEIQDEVKKIGDSFIDEINSFFDTEAEFHSVFLHHKDETNVAFDTSGVISGRNTVSAVYTMPPQATDSIYEKISAILLPKLVRDSGGFYDVARNLSSEQNAKMTFSMIPNEGRVLYQLKLSVDYPNQDFPLKSLRPLEYFKTDELMRSDYFSQGFYPLNSLLQVVVLSDDKILELKPNILEIENRSGTIVPTDLTKNGWFIVSDSQEKKEIIYLFGNDFSVTNDELEIQFPAILEDVTITTPETDDSFIIVAIIVVAAIGASVFYLKGYKKNP
jgi:hypothetical protein